MGVTGSVNEGGVYSMGPRQHPIWMRWQFANIHISDCHMLANYLLLSTTQYEKVLATVLVWSQGKELSILVLKLHIDIKISVAQNGDDCLGSWSPFCTGVQICSVEQQLAMLNLFSQLL